MKSNSTAKVAGGDEFARLLDEYANQKEGGIVKGTITAIDGDMVVIEVGLKSEGRIPVREFAADPSQFDLKPGDVVDVYVERIDSTDGVTMLSREKARREESWEKLEQMHKNGEHVEGRIFSKVKGGFTVDLAGVVAFLPTTQVDVRPVRDAGPLLGKTQPFAILKMDRKRGNVVVSRRALMEEGQSSRSELLTNIREGQVLQGTVKNITDYGAFVDLGGMDGLVHVTDISWKRINHPSEVLKVGQSINVQVIRFDAETRRVSLGIKQLESNPFDNAIKELVVGQQYAGKVSNVTDYGVFVSLPGNIEGLVHVSEISWTKRNPSPQKMFASGQDVNVMVLDIDAVKRRVSLGIKQCQENPWHTFSSKYKSGDVLSGPINNVTEFGLFVGLTPELDGMVHLSDLSWEESGDEAIKKYSKGQTVDVKILEVDTVKERVALGIKQLTEAPQGYQAPSAAAAGGKKGEVVTVTVEKITDNGIEVVLSNGSHGFIKRGDMGRDKVDQRNDRFAVGERIDAKIMGTDKTRKTLQLSIKALEIEEERQAMAEYGSSDSGASLGEILGAALRQKQDADPK